MRTGLMRRMQRVGWRRVLFKGECDLEVVVLLVTRLVYLLVCCLVAVAVEKLAIMTIRVSVDFHNRQLIHRLGYF